MTTPSADSKVCLHDYNSFTYLPELAEHRHLAVLALLDLQDPAAAVGVGLLCTRTNDKALGVLRPLKLAKELTHMGTCSGPSRKR